MSTNGYKKKKKKIIILFFILFEFTSYPIGELGFLPNSSNCPQAFFFAYAWIFAHQNFLSLILNSFLKLSAELSELSKITPSVSNNDKPFNWTLYNFFSSSSCFATKRLSSSTNF